MKNIGQTSQLTGLSQRMLRYFEEQGLLKPNRTPTGIRLFSDGDIAEILRIRNLHDLGFTYPEIKNLLDADAAELARKGTALLQKHHEAALDLQERIQKLEMICFGEKKSTSSGPNGHQTLDRPHRTAYTLNRAAEVSAFFRQRCQLKAGDFSYWKFFWLKDHLKPDLADFTLYEILDGSALLAVLTGSDLLAEYESAWLREAKLSLKARSLGDFPPGVLSEFCSSQELVMEQSF
jgi:DNA-binding transcriptional MerR regulator